MRPRNDSTNASSSSSSSSLPNLPNVQSFLMATLTFPNSYTSSLTLTGDHLLVGSSHSQIHLFKSTSLVSTVVAGNGAVKSLILSSDNLLITAHQDHKIRVWKINTDDGGRKSISRVATLPTLGDRALKLLVPKNHVQVRRHKKQTWVHHNDAISALTLSGDESLLYSVSWDRTLKVWSTSDFKCLESVANAHDDAINTIVVSEVDGHVYTGSSDGKIKAWKRKTGENKHSLIATLGKHDCSGVNALAMSVDGRVLYSGSCDGTILVWKGMEAVGAIQGHRKSVLCLVVLSDLVCSGSADRTLRVWRSSAGVGGIWCCLAVLEGHKGPVKCIAGAQYHDDTTDLCNGGSSCLLYSGGLDSDVKVWKIFVPLS